MPFTIGENVGPYRVVEKLGQGGMATVFKAYHASLDRHVALKVLHPAFKEDPHFLERFHREAKLVARLEHPHIVPIYDFAEHRGQPYLVMKFIHGETLKARLRHGAIKLEEGTGILQAVGGALSYAHEQGILHRDVKPSNILLADDGRIYLADFGLARIAELGASTLSGDMLMGTPHYISPEQARGDEDLDERTDIYSLGIVLYEIVVGRVPFSADTPFSIIHDHIYTPLPLPSDVDPAVPGEIQDVLLKALAKDPADRFRTAQDMVETFGRAIRGLGSVDIPPVDLSDTLSEELDREEIEVAKVDRSKIGPIRIEVMQEKSEPDSKGAPKGRFRWAWMVLGIIITCFSLVAMLAVANRPGIRTLFDDRETGNSPAEVGMIDSFISTEQSDVSPLPTRSPTENDDEPILSPSSHLARAEALLGEGKDAEAIREYMIAGEMYLQLGEPIEAATVLLQATSLEDGMSREEERRLFSLLTQALFFSAPAEEIDHLADSIAAIESEFPILGVIEARRYLFMEEYGRAQRILDGAMLRDSESFLAKAIQAELLFMKGDFEGAKSVLTEIIDRPGLYPWLGDHLRTLQEKMADEAG